MANSYQIIDEKTWNRAIHCAVFRNCVEPAFCVTFEADITNFKRMIKEQGLSFTFAMVCWMQHTSIEFLQMISIISIFSFNKGDKTSTIFYSFSYV